MGVSVRPQRIMNMSTERENCKVRNMKNNWQIGNEFENIGKSNSLFKKKSCEARKLVLQIKETPIILIFTPDSTH